MIKSILKINIVANPFQPYCTSPHIIVNIKGKTVYAVIDTGAGINLMSRELAESLNLNVLKKCNGEKLVFGNGNNAILNKEVKFNLKIDPSIYLIDATLINNPPFDLLIGMKWLLDNNAIINLKKKSVYLDLQIKI